MRVYYIHFPLLCENFPKKVSFGAMRPLVTLFFCFFALSLFDEAVSTCRCVKPRAQDVVNNPCNQNGECHLLMDYVQSPSNFSNDTIFKFLPGDHLLNSELCVHNDVHNLTLSGLSKDASKVWPRIDCNGSSTGLWFKDVSDLQIYGLGIHNCGFQHKNQNQAILLIRVQNLNLSNVRVSSSLGYGIYASDPRGNSTIHSSVVKDSYSKNKCYGGNMAIEYMDKSSQTAHSFLIESSSFLNGSVVSYENCAEYEAYASGLQIFLNTTNIVTVSLKGVQLSENRAKHGGNLAVVYFLVENSTNWLSSVILDNCTLSNGSSHLGGGMFLKMYPNTNIITNGSSDNQFVNVITIKNSRFEGNFAEIAGAGLYIMLFEKVNLSSGASINMSNSTFSFNSINVFSTGGGGVAISILTFELASYMLHRLPQYSISLFACQCYENRIVKLSKNDPVGGGIVYVEQNSLTHFQNVSVFNNSGTGVVLVRSNLVLQGSNTISKNKGNYGGGVALCDNSILYLKNSVELNISNNTALSFGGGIYVEEDCTHVIAPCFFQFDDTTSAKKINMISNLAIKSGSEVFGGSINYCYFFGDYTSEDNYSSVQFFKFFDFPNHNPKDISYISSTPIKTCFCESTSNGEFVPNCDKANETIVVYPGSTFQVPLVVVGQRNGPVPGVVVATNVTKKSNTIETHSCVSLTYELSHTPTSCNPESIIFTVQRTDATEACYKKEPITLDITYKDCPLGFEQQKDAVSCVCISALQRLEGITCFISNLSIVKQKQSQSWFGFSRLNNTTNDEEIVTHHFCPFDYCNRTKTHTINTTQTWTANDQCAFNRYGILCGGCRENHSNVFGSSRCSDCSKTHSIARIIGLLIVFCIAGILLVVFLGVTDMTVAEGTINAIIFYVNFVTVNRSIFFSPSNNNNTHIQQLVDVIKLMISWMNLDLGIDMCFYNGMNAFQKSLLQFIFPLYLWCISGAIVILCKRSIFVSKYFGRNSVKILATVILLSYAKLLRAVNDVLFYSELYHSSSKHYTIMWSVDGNLTYLEGKHMVLFAIAITIALLTLPYTLALLFIQCLRRRSNMKVLFWVNKLKPFFDAYTGPYNDRYHFWTGFLLVLRIILFTVIAVDTHSGEVRNITLVITTTSLLYILSRPGLYKNWVLNLIEVTVYSNLTILAIVTAYNAQFKICNDYIVIECIGSAMLLFCGIVIYHILKKLSITRRWGVVKVWLLDRRWPWMKRKQIRSLILRNNNIDNDNSTSSSDDELDQLLRDAPPVAQYNVYREPLIGNTPQ